MVVGRLDPPHLLRVEVDPHRSPFGKPTVALIVLLSAFVQIPAGHSGVVTQFGAATGQEFPAGLHVQIPLVQGVVDFDIKTQVDTVDSKDAASSDLQGCAGWQ